MVIGLPRSATTWAANWLTCERIFCLHDPLNRLHYNDWNKDGVHFPNREEMISVGVSCSGVWNFPNFVNRHPAKKLILLRDFEEIQASLGAAGLPFLDENAKSSLGMISGPRLNYRDLFNPSIAEIVWEHLTGSTIGFCERRHSILVDMKIEPNFESLNPDYYVTKKLHKELGT